ncbi:hypothetical protein E8E13_004079 [Curvularia kusanoi]|uniref:Uncharacterized protein n=1 Tax=Curvularia kusanoi TaxID=90978 RepID=A0A9P4WA67_CURKU|nr:hypothetical protein E8E13_004079 [Curvularia kusanoi]
MGRQRQSVGAAGLLLPSLEASSSTSMVSNDNEDALLENDGSILANANRSPSRILAPAALATHLQAIGEANSRLYNTLPGLPSDPGLTPGASFALQHMVLLRHADSVPNFTGDNRSIMDIAIQHAARSPFLLDETLAFTAFHLAECYPGSARHLSQLATELQTRALASFSQLAERVPPDDKATAVPRFLFSAILGHHYLADTLAHHRNEFDSFIERIAECFTLSRGIKAVTPEARVFLYESEVRPFLDISLGAQSKIVSPGHECDPLNRLMDSCDLSEVSLTAYRQSISLLQQSFDTLQYLNESDYPQAASTFSVHVQPAFVDALRRHQPEILIILAYYGVLLYHCRTFWPFHNGGGYLVHAIAKYVGSYWREILIWPLSVVGPER